jgi:hypothetical protein
METTEIALVRGENDTRLGRGEGEMLVIGMFIHPSFMCCQHVDLEGPQGADNAARGRVFVEVEPKAQKRPCSRSRSYSATAASSSARSRSISSLFA